MPIIAFSIVAVMAIALVAYLAAHELRSHARRGAAKASCAPRAPADPGDRRRAERRARALLRSVVNRTEWEMYRDLGFIRVAGGSPGRAGSGAGGYGYLIYPHKPIVAYLPGSNSLLSEYCIEFPDLGEPVHGSRLPDSDDVLAKWMMITADEERLVGDANMHLPGRQVDPRRVRRDLVRLAEWERERSRRPPTRRTRAQVVESDLGSRSRSRLPNVRAGRSPAPDTG